MRESRPTEPASQPPSFSYNLKMFPRMIIFSQTPKTKLNCASLESQYCDMAATSSGFLATLDWSRLILTIALVGGILPSAQLSLYTKSLDSRPWSRSQVPIASSVRRINICRGLRRGTRKPAKKGEAVPITPGKYGTLYSRSIWIV